VLLNLGGIANFTWLPPRGDVQTPRFGDTGPGNTLIDRAVRRGFPAAARGIDAGGELAAQGTVHAPLLAALKAHPYFALPCPKSTGPEVFGAEFLEAALAAAGAAALPGQDVVATVTRLTAETVAETLRRDVSALAGGEVFVSGGGFHNRTLMAWLAQLLPGAQVRDSRALGVDPDAKEALLFAVLANELVAGAGFPAPDGSGRRLAFGKISFPD
jgi:anhydro-N-acetylmuramic acid kinase